jgi:ATP-dependent DNA helicase RecQ
MVFSDAVLNAVVLTRPTSIPSLLQLPGIGPRIADTHGVTIIALCRSETAIGIIDSSNPRNIALTASIAPAKSPRVNKEPSTQSRDLSSRPERSGVARSPHFALSGTTSTPIETFHRQRTTSEPTDSLTPKQQQLDERLREWRKSESERLGLPLFFVLASTTLRNIVLAQPQNLTQLKSVHGLGLDKIEKFGPGIIQVCTT